MGILERLWTSLHRTATCLCLSFSGIRDDALCMLAAVICLSRPGLPSERSRIDIFCLRLVLSFISLLPLIAHSSFSKRVFCTSRAFPGLCVAGCALVSRFFQRLPSVFLLAARRAFHNASALRVLEHPCICACNYHLGLHLLFHIFLCHVRFFLPCIPFQETTVGPSVHVSWSGKALATGSQQGNCVESRCSLIVSSLRARGRAKEMDHGAV